ncbi:MAG: penicillin-binding protein 2 [Francisellaceae bacterium]|nr:penicillin-binding protein 2 [Francisellaceae bacterium]
MIGRKFVKNFKILKLDKLEYRGRYYILTGFLLLIVTALCWRIIGLQLYDKKFLISQGDARVQRVVTMAPYRGMITDRNGEPLAISTPVKSIWVNPKEIDLSDVKLPAIAKILQIDEKKLKEKIKRNSDKEFLYLKRQVNPDISNKISNLALNGIYQKSEYRRFYPAGEITAQILGFTNIDGQGQEGLELAYDDWLKGQAGQKRIIRDRTGRQVEYVEALKDMKSGQNLALSIDQRLQYLAYRELKEAVIRQKAEAGSVVILDVQTGEILAMVNQPSYNPNMRIKLRNDSFRNRAVTDVFEPGSVIKTFSVLAALNDGQIKPTTLVDTSPGWLNIGGKIIREDKNKNHGIIDVATIMKKSSNVGVSKLILEAGPDKLWKTYARMGFGNLTGSGFPGESSGTLNRPHKNSPFVLATMAFGYGLTVTPLQLAQAYAILGAKGIKKQVQFLKTNNNTQDERVINPELAQQLVDILKGVIEQPGSNAKVIGYRVAGKTGTARKVGKHGYSATEHISVFAGLIPAQKPRFSIVVMVDKPQNGLYYGNQVAAPLFSKIAAGVVRIFNIVPDVLDNQGLQLMNVEK